MSAAGYPPLVSWVAAHVAALHAPPRPVVHLITCGNTNGVDLVARTLLDAGDAVLAEEFTYAATLQARPRRRSRRLRCALVTFSLCVLLFASS